MLVLEGARSPKHKSHINVISHNDSGDRYGIPAIEFEMTETVGSNIRPGFGDPQVPDLRYVDPGVPVPKTPQAITLTKQCCPFVRRLGQSKSS